VTPDAEHDAFNRIASYVALLMIDDYVCGGVCLVAQPARERQRPGIREMRCGQRFYWPPRQVLMMLRVTNVLWTYLPNLRFVQFPWRGWRF